MPIDGVKAQLLADRPATKEVATLVRVPCSGALLLARRSQIVARAIAGFVPPPAPVALVNEALCTGKDDLTEHAYKRLGQMDMTNRQIR